MKKTLSWSLICLGSFLEIWYYQFRFTADGISIWLSLLIGVSLTLLFALTVHQRILFLIVPLAIYSIFATSAGQAFSLGGVLDSRAEAVFSSQRTETEIEEIQDQIYRNLSEIDRQRKMLSSVVSIEDRARWRTNVNETEKTIADLEEKTKALREKLAEARERPFLTKEIATNQNIYKFYGDMFSWNEALLQFIMQTILSVFIAAMAPVGIIILQTIKKTPPKIITCLKQELLVADIRTWVNVNWIGIRSQKSEKILPRVVFDHFMKDRGQAFHPKTYEKILTLSQDIRIIEKNGKILEKDEKKAIEKIIEVDKIRAMP